MHVSMGDRDMISRIQFFKGPTVVLCLLAMVVMLPVLDSGCTARNEPAALVVYCGRGKDLVGPILEEFGAVSGIPLEVRYGKTAQMAATILEESENSPADVFIAQDAGALGVLGKKSVLAPLSDDLLERVPPRFRSPDGLWVGLSGRARVVVYHTGTLEEEDLPETIFGFVDPKWKGRIGWAPANGSFQAFVTALRVYFGEDRVRAWLQGIQVNEPRIYPKNSPIVAAVGAGEVDVGFVNHYYLYRFLKERGNDFGARNAFVGASDAGTLVNVAGACTLKTSRNQSQAQALIRFLLAEDAQRYFSTMTHEYPLVAGVPASLDLPPLASIPTPSIDLNELHDLEGTLRLIQELRIL